MLIPTNHHIINNASPNKVYTCYVLSHSSWRSGLIPLKDYLKFMGGNHILPTWITNKR
jgi:hypothetical protein